MSILTSALRFVVVNETGITIDSGLVGVSFEPVSGDGSGGPLYSAEEGPNLNNNSITNGGEEVVLTIDPQEDISGTGLFIANLSTNGTSGPDGDLKVFAERSTDGGTDYGRDELPLGIHNFTTLTDKTPDTIRP